jgi:hypothetical protein
VSETGQFRQSRLIGFTGSQRAVQRGGADGFDDDEPRLSRQRRGHPGERPAAPAAISGWS